MELNVLLSVHGQARAGVSASLRGGVWRGCEALAIISHRTRTARASRPCTVPQRALNLQSTARLGLQ
eukprot:scaffold9026_cov69-Phaeocystis_antarctica.AAC.1